MTRGGRTDYVIVGAGSAGCVLANRLSADPSCNVVILEAGPKDGNVLIRMPAGFFGLMKTAMVDWGYYTEPQCYLGNRTIWWPRGKVLGGSSSVNGLVYVRGAAYDFDRWALAGNRNWSYAECLPFFKKSESWSEGANNHFHATSGPLQVSRTGELHPLTQAFIDAGVERGYPRNPDFNGETQEGFGRFDSTTGNNRRSSSSSAFLAPVSSRRNLTVLTRAHVTRVLLKDGRAVGVEYRKNGYRHSLRCEGEVILASGSIASPQLLQVSGIGDPNYLQSVGVPALHDLQGVGRNLQDHIAMTVLMRSNEPVSLYPLTKPIRAAIALAQYMLLNSGPGSASLFEAGAFVRTDPGLKEPDVQYCISRVMYCDHGRKVIHEHGYTIDFNISRPSSRGSISIKSPDVADRPIIQPNYLQDTDDLRVLREAVKICREITSQSVLAKYTASEYAPGASVRTNSEIEDYIRGNAGSNYHPVGTCRMGSDCMAVVDDRLRVRGLEGLRVVDASIMPSIVSGNTNAAAIMIGERGADFILNQ
jgi:choline dehydrogenase